MESPWNGEAAPLVGGINRCTCIHTVFEPSILFISLQAGGGKDLRH
jgi:hypothetical protein